MTSATFISAGHERPRTKLRRAESDDTEVNREERRSAGDPEATRRENLISQGHLYGLCGPAFHTRVGELLDRFHLPRQPTGRGRVSGGKSHLADEELAR
jgi:hypothetical protein